MNTFSTKSLLSLGDYYVYGLIDPRDNNVFYIGKGTGNRVFDHESQSQKSPNSQILKLSTIKEIKDAGLEVKKIIISSNLTESEAFAAEAALINAFNYMFSNKLTNIASGHHSHEALSVEDFEKLNGAEELSIKDIGDKKIMVIKINKLYHRGMNDDEIYNAVRGIWNASLKRAEKVEYVFAVYCSLIVGVYKPTKWYVCSDNGAKNFLPEGITPDQINQYKNRIFFIDSGFESHDPLDPDGQFFSWKSIANIKGIQSAQNPITYLNC